MIHALAALALLYLLVCLLAFLFQEKLVYFPERALVATPAQVGLNYQDVEFTATDGVRLHGWFLPAEPARAVLLFCHGNAGNISGRLESLKIFHDLGLAIFIFDYRGYGRSAGRPGEAGTYADAHGAWQHLTGDRGIAPADIVIFGRSLGGAVAIELASQVNGHGLIVEATFTSAVELGARAYPWLPVRQLGRIRYDSLARVHRVRGPKLFIHSLNDEVVPYTLGLKLYDRAREPKTLLKIRGSHGDGFLTSGQLYTEGLERFLASLRPADPESS